MQRFRETHDLVHVLLGLPPTVKGELALKWFELVQTGLPVSALSAFVGPAALAAADRRDLRERILPWVMRSGRHARFMQTVYFEEHFDSPLADVRALLGITEEAPYMED